jgi:hypothetical protein
MTATFLTSEEVLVSSMAGMRRGAILVEVADLEVYRKCNMQYSIRIPRKYTFVHASISLYV